eukprot:981490-Pleurochrysis_carterae.AAC.1
MMGTATSKASAISASDEYGSASSAYSAWPPPGPRHAAIAARAARNAPPRSSVLQSADPSTAAVSPNSHPPKLWCREVLSADTIRPTVRPRSWGHSVRAASPNSTRSGSTKSAWTALSVPIAMKAMRGTQRRGSGAP